MVSQIYVKNKLQMKYVTIACCYDRKVWSQCPETLNSSVNECLVSINMKRLEYECLFSISMVVDNLLAPVSKQSMSVASSLFYARLSNYRVYMTGLAACCKEQCNILFLNSFDACVIVYVCPDVNFEAVAMHLYSGCQ